MLHSTVEAKETDIETVVFVALYIANLNSESHEDWGNWKKCVLFDTGTSEVMFEPFCRVLLSVYK